MMFPSTALQVPRRFGAAALALVLSLGGCQSGEQAPTAVQPEKLPSATSVAPASVPPAAATTATPVTAATAKPAPADAVPAPSETVVAAAAPRPTTASETLPDVGAAKAKLPATAADKAKKGSKKKPPPGPLLPYAKGKKPKPAPFSADPDPTPRAKAKPPPPAKPLPPPKLTVVDKGRAPRKLLRIATKAGHAEKMRMMMQMAIAMEVGGKKAPASKLPPMFMDMSLKVAEVKDHTIRYDFVLSDTKVPPTAGVDKKVSTVLDKALANLKGMKGVAIIGDNGITKKATIEMPGKVDAQTQQVVQGMEQALQQISAPLPDEEVGVGAKWKLVTHLRQNGVSLKQTAHYELKKLGGKQVQLALTLAQAAPKQQVHSPVGVVVDLLALDSGGGGDMTVQFDRLAPIRSKLDMTSNVTMGLPDKRKMKMRSKMAIGINLPSK